MVTRAIRNRLERATEGSGQRFGERSPVQRNVESDGPNPDRSPGESNANRWAPDIFEDTNRAQPRDTERIRRAVRYEPRPDLTEAQERFRERQVRAAGARAGLRTAGRAGYLGGALGLGAKFGSKLVELNEAAERGRRDRRIQEENEKELDKVSEPDMPKREDVVGMAKGGSVSASRRADGCAQRGKTRGRVR